MTIVCPRYFSVAVASARITWSVEPPAGQGTIKVTGREGKLWAKAPNIASDAAARTNHFRRRGMRSSAIVGAIGEYTAGRPKLPGPAAARLCHVQAGAASPEEVARGAARGFG